MYLDSEELKVCVLVSCDFFAKSTADNLLVGAAGGTLLLAAASCELLILFAVAVEVSSTGLGNGRKSVESGKI